MLVRPSKTFVGLLKQYGSPSAAAIAWSIYPRVLYRFLKGKGMTLEMATRIASRSGHTLDELFVFEEEDKL